MAPAVIFRKAAALLVGPEDHHLLEAVLVQVGDGVFHIAHAFEHFFRTQQLFAASGAQGIDGQSLQLRIHLPAHHQFRPPVRVEVGIIDGGDGAAAALDDGGGAVLFVYFFENIDLQGLFILVAAQEGDGLFPSVAVQVHHLYALDPGAGGGGGVFRALRQKSGYLGVEGRILGGQLRQGVKLLGVEIQFQLCIPAARKAQGHEQSRHGGEASSFHSRASFPFDNMDPFLLVYDTTPI